MSRSDGPSVAGEEKDGARMSQSTGRDEQVVYQIRVRGMLDSGWSDWFDGLTLCPEANGDTVLTGPVRDQSALHGLLSRIRDLGLPLLSLNRKERNMISRIWHGWTTPENADAYESLLRSEILPGIRERRIAGCKSIHLLRRDLGDEAEFVTIMWFDSLDAVRIFAGEDYEVAVVPAEARALLSRFDARSQHYEVRTEVKA
jgi:hypothetical protein